MSYRSKSPITEQLLLTVSFITLLGVVGTITFISLTNDNLDLLNHFRRNSCRIAFAVFITLICVLEMIGCNWDRGYLDRVIDFVNKPCGRGRIVLEEEGRKEGEEKNLVEEDEDVDELLLEMV